MGSKEASASRDRIVLIDTARIREDFPILSRTVNRDRSLVFFDNAASTQHPRQVLDAMTRFYESSYANVHRGVHRLSQEASDAYDAARTKVARFIGAYSESEVIFTSGTTLAINLVARSWGDANLTVGDEILLTEMEHHSNIVPWQQLAQRTGAVVKFLPIREDGTLAMERLEEFLSSKTKLLAVTAVSNVLGTINPVPLLIDAARRVGARVLIDAAQHVPHEPTDVSAWGADFVAFSGHKMLGPTGIGVLWGKLDLLNEMPCGWGGGSMITEVTTQGFLPNVSPAKFEAGTPPIAEAVGLAAAIDYLEAVGIKTIGEHERSLVAAAFAAVKEIPGLRIFGPSPELRAGMLSFVVDGINSQDLCQFLDLRGFALRNGHHCAMPLHQRLGIASSCRASFYAYNTLEEVEAFGQALRDVIERLR